MNSFWQVILTSTIISSIISGFFNMANNKRTIHFQKEIAKMEHNDKLFNQSQLEWLDKVRNSIIHLESACTDYNHVLETKHDYDSAGLKEDSDERKRRIIKTNTVSSSLIKETSLLSLYLFHDDFYEQKLLEVVEKIARDYSEAKQISTESLGELLDVGQKLIKDKMEKMR